MEGHKRWGGKIALVTGASSGIGEAIARAFAGIRMKVAVASRRKERLDALVSELSCDGADMLAVGADVSKEEDVLSLFASIHEHWGSIDVLVNNAGTGIMSTIAEGKTEDWRETMNVNVVATSVCIREALKDLETKEEAQIINISSVYAHRLQVPNFALYQASKFAILGLTGSLRAELHASGSKVKVGMISPGLVATEFRERATHGKFTYKSYFKDFQPLMPKDIAEAALYLLSTPNYVQVQDIILSPIGQGL